MGHQVLLALCPSKAIPTVRGSPLLPNAPIRTLFGPSRGPFPKLYVSQVEEVRANRVMLQISFWCFMIIIVISGFLYCLGAFSLRVSAAQENDAVMPNGLAERVWLDNPRTPHFRE